MVTSWRLPPAASRVEDVRTIVVHRSEPLGDTLCCLPALEALSAAYPEAQITLLGLPWQQEFFAGRPSPVHRVVLRPPVVPSEAAGALAERERFFAAMCAERFDLALQLYGGGRDSNPFVSALGARVTAGLRAPGAPPLDRWIPYDFYHPEVLRCLDVAGLVGAAPVTVEPHVNVTAADLAASERALPATDRPIAVVHPGANDFRRRWPAERFAQVAEALAATGALVVVTGVAAERDVAASVVEGSRAPLVNLCGRLSLSALTGLLARAAVMVANDTGPLHLAQAVGTPSAGIYWCGNLLNYGPARRGLHRPAVSWRLACPACGLDCTRARCAHDDSFVADVPLDEVLDNARLLLAEAAPVPRPLTPA